MMLTPADIDKIRFSTTRLKEGYDQDEVDSFLDRVSEDYAFVTQQLARLEAENEVLRRRPTEAPTAVLEVRPDPPTAVAEKLLAAAEQAARETEAEAKAEADRVVREAGGRGARIVEEAKEAAERIKDEGYAEKAARHAELDEKYTSLVDAYNKIDADGRRLRLAMASALAAYDREADGAA